MASFTKLKLSGSTDGKQIKVTGTGTGSTVTVHTAHASALDEIWLYADNSSTSDILLTIEWGATTDPDNIFEVTIPGLGTAGVDGIVPVIPGLIITNSLVVKAFAGTGNVLKLSGYVNRIA